MAAFASESTNLQSSIRLLAPTLENANAALASLNEAFPPTRAFAREILPGVRETPATIEASFPWVDQTRKLLSQSELRGLAQDLAPATRDLAQRDRRVAAAAAADQRHRAAARATSILPTGDIVVRDEFDHRRRELQGVLVRRWSGSPARARTSTATAPTCASSRAAAADRSRSATASSPTGQLIGSSPAPVLGVRPKYPGKRPPYNSSVALLQEQDPRRQRVRGPPSGPGEGERHEDRDPQALARLRRDHRADR